MLPSPRTSSRRSPKASSRRNSEVVLTEQPMANGMKYPNTSVGAALAKAGLNPVKFVRLKVGAVAL